jgi:uncharacterized alpha-E superfamily protein
MSKTMTTLAQVHAMLPGSELIHADNESAQATPISRVGSDSRQIESGELFIALAGERFDAHDFLDDPAKLFEWVKFRSHLSRGVTIGTMLKDEARNFMRLGTYLERGDNTARLVDVKYHAIESDFFGEANDKDQEYDFYHWSAILRSVSAFEIYRKVYRDVIRPDRVAELLILRADMPRSLHACLEEVVSNLSMVSDNLSSETLHKAGKLLSELKFGRISEIMDTGLHAFLTQYLDRVNVIGESISADFLVAS